MSGETEVYFYHLEGRTLEQVLPTLLERSLERGWRAVVQASSPERVEALNTLLWTFREDSFLPHGTSSDGTAAMQPIFLTVEADNPNDAAVRFLVDGATLDRLTLFTQRHGLHGDMRAQQDSGQGRSRLVHRHHPGPGGKLHRMRFAGARVT